MVVVPEPTRNDFFGYRRFWVPAKHIKPIFLNIKVKGRQCLDVSALTIEFITFSSSFISSSI